MARLLPLLALALLPAAIAAPIPPGASHTPEFGESGLVTAADFAQIKFDSRKVTRTEERERQRDRVQSRAAPPKFDVAVHMPRTRFRSGESIPAFFVVRNCRNYQAFLDARLELTPHAPTVYNDCEIRVTSLTTKETVVMTEGLRATHGEGIQLRPNGFYCVRGDLGRSWEQRPLPPGDYLVDWRCEKWRSAPVRFTVLPAAPNAMILTGTRPKELHYFLIESDPDGERAASEQDGPFVWAWLELEGVDESRMASALACGVDDVYAPNPHAIPARDGLAEVFASWTTHPDGDRVTVTLRSSKPNRGVDLADVPHFALVIERQSVSAREQLADRKAKELLAELDPRISLPFAVELRLPKDWRETTEVRAGDRIAVLVMSQKPELPHGDRLEKVLEKETKDEDEPTTPSDPIWRGILQTAFAELPVR